MICEPESPSPYRFQLNVSQRFMSSLRWVDETYLQKHKAESSEHLRALYWPNLQQYSATESKKSTSDAIYAFLIRFGRRAIISLTVYFLSFVPFLGRFVLPAASFYTFRKAVGTQPALVIFGSSIFLPRKILVIFLQTYFASRSLMRELVRAPSPHRMRDLLQIF